MHTENKNTEENKINIIIRKVRKALALAKDTPSDSESQTAMLLAQKMMAEHSLSMSDIEIASDKPSQKVTNDSVVEAGRIHWWQKTLSTIIADNFRCYAIIYKGMGSSKMVFLGKENDVELAKEVYMFAEAMIKSLSKDYVKGRGIKGNRAYTQAIKNDYITGFLKGLKDKFKEQVEKEGWGLVLVKDTDLVKHYNELGTKKSRSSSSHLRRGDDDAVNSGYNDGKRFDQNRKHIKA